MPLKAAEYEEMMTEKIAIGPSNANFPTTSERQVDNTRKLRLVFAFALAGMSDLLSVWLEILPPMQWLLDVVTAGLLFLILGRQWMILPGLIAEAIPGLALFPSWLLVVGSILAWGTIRSHRMDQTLKPESPMRKAPN